MDKTEIISKLQDVFRDVLDNENINLFYETSADDIEEWDSLSHIQLIVSIEKAFSVKFSSRELLSWDTVGDMIDCISRKCI